MMRFSLSKAMSIALTLIMMVVVPAFAAPQGSLTVSPATGTFPYTASVVWSVTGVTACTASGGWSGAKSPSGTQSVTISADAKFTLTCSDSTGAATVTWVPPVKRTDGSALTNLAGFNIFRGPNSLSLLKIKSMLAANLDSYIDSPLPAGNYVYALTAVDDAGTESALSNVASLTVKGATWTQTASATGVTKPAPPAPPGNVTAIEVPVFAYRPSSNTFASAGNAKVNATCTTETKKIGGVTYCRLQSGSSSIVISPAGSSVNSLWLRVG